MIKCDGVNGTGSASMIRQVGLIERWYLKHGCTVS